MDYKKAYSLLFRGITEALEEIEKSHIIYSVVFVLSFRNILLLFFAMASMITILLGLNEIHFKLYFILTMINMGAFLISKQTSSIFIHSGTGEIKTIARLRIGATTDRLTQLLNRNGLEQATETA